MRRKSERATPKKAETTVTPRRTRRGRGAARSPTPEEEVPEENQVTIETEEQEEVQQPQEEESEDEVIPLPKKRGRRSTRQSSTDVESTPTTKRRGRQRRVTQVSEVIEEEVQAIEDVVPQEEPEKEAEIEHQIEHAEIQQEEYTKEEPIYEQSEEVQQETEEQEQVEAPPIEIIDEESNAVSEAPSEIVQETPDGPSETEETPVKDNIVAEESSKDSDIVEIQPAQEDFDQTVEPNVPEEDNASRESGEIVEEKTVPEPVPEIPKRQRRKFMTHSSIQATRNDQKQENEGVVHETPDAIAPADKEEAPKDLSETQQQHDKNDTNERVSNKKRSSRSKENDHNNLDVVTNTNNKNKSSIKSGGGTAGDIVTVEKESNNSNEEPMNDEKENEPSATAAISAAPLPAGQRKRKWITQKSVDNKPAIISISTDSLKELIPEVVPVALNDIQMDVSPEAGEILEDSNTDKENDATLRKRRISEKSVETNDKQNKKRKAGSQEKTQVSTKITETLNNKEKPPLPPSPPKQTQSNILYITNLVRPFTVLQLKGLLARTGKIIENGFWIDKIKSKCYVKYETEDEAVETRHALHGVRWPTSNPKCLNVDFGREKDMEKAIISTMDITRTVTTTDPPKEASGGFGWTKADAFRTEVDQKSSWDKDRPVREWDLGKKDELHKENDVRQGRDDRRRDRGERKRSQEPDDLERRDRRRSRSYSPGRRKDRKTENEPPIRLLDDLFRKTKATPCIYWLPLTAEQIAEREEIRRKRLEEQDRQMKEMQKAREERMKERERLRQERQRSRSRDNKDRDRSDKRRRSRSRSRSRDRRRYNR